MMACTAGFIAPVISLSFTGNCGFGFDCGAYDPGYGYGAAREMPLPAAAIIARGRL